MSHKKEAHFLKTVFIVKTSQLLKAAVFFLIGMIFCPSPAYCGVVTRDEIIPFCKQSENIHAAIA
jgi:hypothetical protein